MQPLGTSDTEAQPEMPRMGYSIKETCRLIGLSRTTLYHHIKAGRLRAVRLGGRTIIPAAELRNLMRGKEAAQ